MVSDICFQVSCGRSTKFSLPFSIKQPPCFISFGRVLVVFGDATDEVAGDVTVEIRFMRGAHNLEAE